MCDVLCVGVFDWLLMRMRVGLGVVIGCLCDVFLCVGRAWRCRMASRSGCLCMAVSVVSVSICCL